MTTTTTTRRPRWQGQTFTAGIKFFLTPSQRDRLERLAKARQSNISWVVRDLLVSHPDWPAEDVETVKVNR